LSPECLGGLGLIATCAVAFIAHAVRGQFATSLLFFIVAVIFVTLHGPVRHDAASVNAVKRQAGIGGV
jgi:hypothetical protein